ncbi:DUF6804 family protein [Aquimarina sp. RZ0]|uniref:DUF6804 family protein n=1 Tax=Aquimarina sp. RZ0 TaxID=2607730 RepID=UPI0011F24362|nr:DUF6804 family protein [Aquimarina sp. RZ0]KAA1245869.1 hypothetical protein F0000_09935 [Aquimarina sp. RZ0]
MKQVSKKISSVTTYSSMACAIVLVLGIFYFPIVYYTFLRAFITLGAIHVIIRSSIAKEYLWAAIFLIIAILFNPYVPIYLYQKFKWIWIDLLVALLFLMDFYQPKPKKEEKTKHKQTIRRYHRDKIY